uniref:Uncharacterized protein n=1 Tax=Arundo donax TaxID=35708 RepID=A0A0A9HDM3_ARUDO
MPVRYKSLLLVRSKWNNVISVSDFQYMTSYFA